MMKLIISKYKRNYVRIYDEEDFVGLLSIKLLPHDIYLKIPAEIVEDTEFYYNFKTDSEYQSFKKSVQENIYDTALQKLLDYVAKAERTVFDCKQLLKRHDVPASMIEKLITVAKEKKWVSDIRYAQLFTDDGILFGKSPYEIKCKLYQKNIDKSIIDSVLAEKYSRDKKNEVLIELIDKSVNKYISVSFDKKKIFDKIATNLYRKGFLFDEFNDILHKKLVSISDE